MMALKCWTQHGPGRYASGWGVQGCKCRNGGSLGRVLGTQCDGETGRLGYANHQMDDGPCCRRIDACWNWFGRVVGP
jgi:hypothetical protein